MRGTASSALPMLAPLASPTANSVPEDIASVASEHVEADVESEQTSTDASVGAAAPTGPSDGIVWMPADKTGIIIHGENKWKTIIQNASKK